MYFLNRQFNDVTLCVISEADELKKMRRSFKIKRAEADEDKKALKKYKYDP